MKNVGIFPLIAGIVSIVALLTPADLFRVSIGTERYREFAWMMGLLFWDYLDVAFIYPDYEFGVLYTAYAYEMFIFSIISVIILIVCISSNIITGNKLRGEKRQFHEIKKTWIATGILYLAAATIYIVGSEIGFSFYKLRTYGAPVSYWENRIPLFGIIGLFISGGLVIIGTILGIKAKEREEVITPSTQIEATPKIQSVPKPTTIIEKQTYKYCPECGTKNELKTAKFCVNCGITLISE
jgi:hypothetical protein